MSKVQEDGAGENNKVARLGALESAVVHTLLYFDIFTYPLTEAEIANCLPLPASPADAGKAIRGLAERGLIFRHGDFYQLTDAPTGSSAGKRAMPLRLKG